MIVDIMTSFWMFGISVYVSRFYDYKKQLCLLSTNSPSVECFHFLMKCGRSTYVLLKKASLVFFYPLNEKLHFTHSFGEKNDRLWQAI